MTRRFLFISALVASAIILSGCRDDGPPKKQYAFITNCVADFWTIGQVGAEKAAADLGVDVRVMMPSSLSDQKQILEDSITRG